MSCANCEERRKIMREAWEAARAGDLKTYQEKAAILVKSSVRSLLSSMKNQSSSHNPK